MIPLHMSDRYFAFISYANAHRKWVASLQKDLERCLDHYARTVDPNISRRVFLDQVDLQSGRTWIDQFQEAVEKSERLILVVSPEALESDWVQVEWQSFFTRRPKDVFPVLIADVELPAFLDPIQWIDFTGLEGAEYDERLTQLFGDLLRQSRRDPPPMPDGLGPRSVEPPEPSFDSDATRDLALALKAAYRQRAETQASGGDVTELNETIVGIKRELRSGPQLQAGDFLDDDRFELLDRIGKGGFATVWKAYDHEQHSVVAVKVLHSQYSEDKSRRDRFFRGARHMAKLRHRGIVSVVEAECEDGGYHFFVMEYVAGGDFCQAVLDGGLSIEERLGVVLEVGEALHYAHAQGIVHRDVKPANILLGLEGHPKLTDFDLVRAADTTGGTRTAMLGTILYAAPEAMLDGKQAAEPADVYGLGMTAIFAVHGADLPATALWELPALVDGLKVDAGCREVLGSAVSRELSSRSGSIASFCEGLRQALRPPKIERKKSTPVTRRVPAPQQLSRPGIRERVHERDGSVLVSVPGGVYTLGADDLGLESSEPVHRVELSAFEIGKHPVTNEQYSRFLESTGHQEPRFWSNGRFNAAGLPVVGVSWADAVAYTRWAGLWLPSEAQWEAAARGLQGLKYPWGDEAPTSERADYGKDWEKDRPDIVGSHPSGAGPFGAEDQSGGVWEWCLDVWDSRAFVERNTQRDLVIPLLESPDELSAIRVVRGGSWVSGVGHLPAAFRGRNRAGDRDRSLGFRVVCGSAPEP